MADIKIPTYRTLVPNSTFGRKAKPAKNMTLETDGPATQIMQITRYSVPTENEIINLIQTAARDFNPLSTAGECSEERGEIPISEIIGILPKDIIDEIAKGNEDSLHHLREHYFKGTYQPKQTYVQILNCVVYNDVLDSVRNLLDEKKAIAYELIIDRFSLRGGKLKMRLKGEDTLPDKLEIEYLLNRGVRDCDVFQINHYEEYQNAAEQIMSLYNFLNSPQEMKKVEDASEMFLKTRATNTIEAMASCVSKANRIMGSFGEGLMKSLSQTMTNEFGCKKTYH